MSEFLGKKRENTTEENKVEETKTEEVRVKSITILLDYQRN